MKIIRNAALLLAVLCASGAFGVSTRFWTSSTFEDFGRGNFSGISLSREGALQLAPALDEIFNSDQAMIWAGGRDPGGNLYLGTGHSGKGGRRGGGVKGGRGRGGGGGTRPGRESLPRHRPQRQGVPAGGGFERVSFL